MAEYGQGNYKRDKNNVQLTGSWAEKALGHVIRNVGGLNPRISETTGRRGDPPVKSVIRERSTRSTSTAGQKARLAAAARTGKVQAQRGVSARRNAADISMNNPPVVTDSGGHRVSPKTGNRMHSFGTERNK
tara:strand:- start:666 stop:1061 length:396 start_codon:yes stop_codon:yes gene_type:complete